MWKRKMPDFPKPEMFSLALLWLYLGVPPRSAWGTGVGLCRLAMSFHGWKWKRELKRPGLHCWHSWALPTSWAQGRGWFFTVFSPDDWGDAKH